MVVKFGRIQSRVSFTELSAVHASRSHFSLEVPSLSCQLSMSGFADHTDPRAWRRARAKPCALHGAMRFFFNSCTGESIWESPVVCIGIGSQCHPPPNLNWGSNLTHDTTGVSLHQTHISSCSGKSGTSRSTPRSTRCHWRMLVHARK